MMIRVLDLEFPKHPYLNMAFEEAIPLAVGEGIAPETLRFWRNDGAVVIGRFQCPSLEVEFDSCLEHNVKVVRRFTGGGAVYHDLGNLNFALSLRRSNPLIGERLFRGFELLGRAIELGIRRLGSKHAKFKPVNNVFLGDLKVSGMAGLITKDFVFVHGSLLVSSDLGVLNRVLKAPKGRSKEKFVRSRRQKVTTLERALGRSIRLKEVKEAIKEGIKEILGVELIDGVITDYEKELAKKLYEEKFSKLSWSLGPCTSCPRRKTDEMIFKRLTFDT
ncbi:MAG: lipoate--protein ligase family protein, partial [Thermoproteota archaeon]